MIHLQSFFIFIFSTLTRMQSYISTWRSKRNPAGHGVVSADPTTGIHLFEFYYTKMGNFFGSSQKLHTGNPRIPIEHMRTQIKYRQEGDIGRNSCYKLTFLLVLHVANPNTAAPSTPTPSAAVLLSLRVTPLVTTE